MKALATEAVSRLLLLVSQQMWGVGPTIMPVIVRNFGPFGAIKWFVRYLPPYERALKDLGGARTNLICCAASLFNGCAYCVYACGRSFQLYYFEERGKLFPLDDHEIVGLIELPDDDMRAKLDAALAEAGLDEDLRLIRRLYAIKLEGDKPRPGEEFLEMAIHMFDDLNFCSIGDMLGADEAHDRVNRDADLKARYAAARLAARTAAG
jgi:hypothetical protein